MGYQGERNNRKIRHGNRNNDNRRGRNDERNQNRDGPVLSESDSLKARLSMLILKIGDKVTPTFQKNLDTLSKVLVKDYEICFDSIMEFLKACILEIPSRNTIYASLIALTLNRNEEVGKAIIDGLVNELQEQINAGEWVNTKIMLRFFGELVHLNAISVGSFLKYYQTILIKLDDKVNKDIKDCMINLILGSLPWVGKVLNEKKPEALTYIFDKISEYMSIREQSHDLRLTILKPFPKVENNEAQFEALSLLWKQINNLKENNWEVKELLRFDLNNGSEVKTIDLREIQLPSNFNDLRFPPPTFQFLLFPEHESLIYQISYYIITDIISDTIDIFHTNRRECVRLLINLRENFSYSTFKPLISDSEIKDNNDDMEDGNEIKYNGDIDLMNMITEVYFLKMFKLPNSKHKLVYYSSLIIETFKAEQKDFSKSFNVALKSIFIKSRDMEIECIDRFYNWFSHYLSNFEYNFEWEEFNDVIDLDPFDPRKIIISETLAKIIRLSYYDRIKATIPESMHNLILDKAPEPNFNFRKVPEDAPHKRFCTLIVEAFRSKKDVDFFSTLIRDARDELLDDNLIRQIVIETILIMGSKSFTHMMNVTEKHLKLYQEITKEPNEKQQVVSIVGDFWKENPQWLTIQLNRLISYHIIEPITVISWIFNVDNYENFNKCYIWEILYSTLNTARLWKNQQKEKYEQSCNDDTLTDEGVQLNEVLLNQFNQSQSDFKNVLLEILQCFINVLTNLMSQINNNGSLPEQDGIFNLVLGRFKEFCRKCELDIKEFNVTIETLIFTDSVHPELRAVYDAIKGLNQPPSI